MTAADLKRNSAAELAAHGLPYVNASMEDLTDVIADLSLPDGWHAGHAGPGRHAFHVVPVNAVRIGQVKLRTNDPEFVIYAWQGDRGWMVPGANLPPVPAGLQRALPGRPRQNRAVTRVDWQLDTDVVAILDAERALTGETYHELIRRLAMLAFACQERFAHD